VNNFFGKGVGTQTVRGYILISELLKTFFQSESIMTITTILFLAATFGTLVSTLLNTCTDNFSRTSLGSSVVTTTLWVCHLTLKTGTVTGTQLIAILIILAILLIIGVIIRSSLKCDYVAPTRVRVNN